MSKCREGDVTEVVQTFQTIQTSQNKSPAGKLLHMATPLTGLDEIVWVTDAETVIAGITPAMFRVG